GQFRGRTELAPDQGGEIFASAPTSAATSVGDFGLAKLVDAGKTNVTTQVRRTIGHIAPEYLSLEYLSLGSHEKELMFSAMELCF
ncbi:hypothetical protein TorRG33x02_105810, partial [Trema orientale]